MTKPQHQGSLHDQLNELIQLAAADGLYDAADFITRGLSSRSWDFKTVDKSTATPIQRGFEYEVKLAVSIPLAWATLLKAASKHHYDHRCNEAGHHGVINGLYNTALDSEYPSTLAMSWRDLDLTTKVAEQLEHHTTNHEMIRAIRTWLRETMDTIERQHNACTALPGTTAKEPTDFELLQEELHLRIAQGLKLLNVGTRHSGEHHWRFRTPSGQISTLTLEIEKP